MNNIKKSLYIGSGLHIEPVIDFIHTQEFIFIDIQPFTEFEYDKNDTFNDKFCRKNFVNNLKKKCVKIGFNLKEVRTLDYSYIEDFLGKYKYYCLKKLNILPEFCNPTLLLFENNKTNQKIRYYISTSIKNNMGRLNGLLEKEISECDSIIVSGYDPDSIILDCIKQPIIFIGYSDTCYDINYDDNNDNNNIIQLTELMNSSDKIELEYYFSKYYLVKYKEYKSYKIENNRRILEFNNYDNFKNSVNIFDYTDEDI